MTSLLVDAHLSQMILLKELHPFLRTIQNKSLEEAKLDLNVQIVSIVKDMKSDMVKGGEKYGKLLEDARNLKAYDVEIMSL